MCQVYNVKYHSLMRKSDGSKQERRKSIGSTEEAHESDNNAHIASSTQINKSTNKESLGVHRNKTILSHKGVLNIKILNATNEI